MKTNLKNTKYSFSKGFYKALIAPIVVGILAIVLACTVGFNKGLDYTGGIVVSVVAGTETKLDDKKTYNEFKAEVDDVLKTNDVNGQVYTVEVNEMQEYCLVVKFAFNGNQTEKEALINAIKSDLITKFYAQTPAEDIENNNYVLVAEFGSAVDGTVVVTTALATLVCAILMCAYIMARMGVNAGVLSFVSAVFNNAFALALLMVARVQLTYVTFIAIPFVTVISILASFIYLKKAKDMLQSTEKYDRQSNYVLADDVTKAILNKVLVLSGVSAFGVLTIGVFNVLNSILFVCLALFTCIACMLYSNVLLLPGLFAKTYVRKIRKAKKQKEEKQEPKLTQEEVMQETDLDNLVSN